MAEATIILWNHEPYYGSPARKEFSLNWEGELLRADLTLDVDPYSPGWPIFGGCVNRIVVNGTDVQFTGDPCNVMTADLRPYLRKGANVIEFYHNANPIPGIQSGGAYGYIVIEATGQAGGEVKPEACKIFFGLIPIGEVPEPWCGIINAATIIAVVAVAGIIVYKVVT